MSEKKKPKCIFITGMGHSGTRLMTHMFNQHPEVSVPMTIINKVAEYTPIHHFFINSMDKTPLSSEEYTIDYKELEFIMDSYMSKIDLSKDFFIFKLPYYPLNCLDFFTKYFDENLILLNVRRPKAKVLQSFVNKGEDRTLFLENSVEFYRQIKKLEPSRRKYYLVSRNAEEFFSDLYDYTEDKVRVWNKNNPDLQFIDVDIEKFATSKEYLGDLIANLSLSSDCLDEMFSVVDKKRLLLRFKAKLKRLVPPSLKPMLLSFSKKH